MMNALIEFQFSSGLFIGKDTTVTINQPPVS